jgi:hypothetical protein
MFNENQKIMTLIEKAKAIMPDLEATFNEEVTYNSTGTYKGKVSIWENYGKARLYIPRNAFEQAGYIDLETGEINETRPGNYSDLRLALEMLEEDK